VFRTIWGRWRRSHATAAPGGVAADKYPQLNMDRLRWAAPVLQVDAAQIGTAQHIDEATGAPQFSAWWQWWVRNDLGQAYPITITGFPVHAGRPDQVLHEWRKNRSKVSFLIRMSLPTIPGTSPMALPRPPGTGPSKVPGATAEWVMERPADAPDPTPGRLPTTAR